MSVMCVILFSTDLSDVLTLENVSSIGARLGE